MQSIRRWSVFHLSQLSTVLIFSFVSNNETCGVSKTRQATTHSFTCVRGETKSDVCNTCLSLAALVPILHDLFGQGHQCKTNRKNQSHKHIANRKQLVKSILENPIRQEKRGNRIVLLM